MLTMSILRGTIETEQEFKLVVDHEREGDAEAGGGCGGGYGGVCGIEATPAKGRSSGRKKRGRCLIVQFWFILLNFFFSFLLPFPLFHLSPSLSVRTHIHEYAVYQRGPLST